MKTKTYFAFRVDVWDGAANSIVEHVAGVDDFEVAVTTYQAAVARWPRARITLRQGIRVARHGGRLGLIRPKHILYKVMKLGQSLIAFLKRLYMAEAYWQLLRRDTVEIREDLTVRLHLGQNILPKDVPIVLHPLAFDVFCTSRDDDENGRGVERRINGFLKI